MRLETTPPKLMLQITCEGLKNGGIRLGPASRSLTFRITSGPRMAAAPNTEQKTPNMSGPSNPLSLNDPLSICPGIFYRNHLD
jgi:hypothetical protein